jgi:four helix bundle protein
MQKPIRDFRDLIVWQKAILLGKLIYLLTRSFPADERFGLTNQMRRAAVSVSSNIAEGHARSGREFRPFLSIARGSVAEVESQLLLAIELRFTTCEIANDALALCDEIKRMCAAIMSKLRSN